MIIHTTKLSTLEQVQTIYGESTTWIQHSGYMLRGATSGVVANSATKTGGNDNAIVVSHSHTVGYTYQYIGYTTGSTGYTLCKLKNADTGEGDYSTKTGGSSGTNANIPNYKSVYIWERTA